MSKHACENASVSDLVVRKIPFDLAAALRAGGAFHPEWFEDKGTAYLALGYSFQLEYTEHNINAVMPAIAKYISDPHLREKQNIFNHQESNHAKYHRVMNDLALQTAVHREKHNPRVYDFFYPSYKITREPLMRALLEGTDEAERMAAIKEAVFRIAVFESSTCMAGLSFFETFFADGKLPETASMTRNLAILYLFGYHLAEEIEHCTTALDVYEALFAEPVWSPAAIEKIFAGGGNFFEQETYAGAFFVAKAANVDLTLADLQRNQFALTQRKNMERAIAPGFHPGQGAYAARRRQLVSLWDSEWEPALRERIERHMQ